MSTPTTPIVEHYVGGKTYSGEGTETLPIENPATAQVIGELRLGTLADLDKVVEVATEAAAVWGDYSIAKRTAVLFAFRKLLVENTDALAQIISAEHGKTFDDAKGEIARGLEVVDFACSAPTLLKGEFSDQASTGIDVHSIRQPLGVVAGITPFNFPVMVPLWMCPTAIVAGNAFVLKPSEKVPSAGNFLADLWTQAGLPDGVFSVLHGGRDIVTGILDHPGISAVSFVGSTAVAKIIQERGTLAGKRVQALGGAKNHAIVMPDADMDMVADNLAAAAFGAAGERCMSISVAIAVGDAADRLVTKVVEAGKKVSVNVGIAPGADMGPVITKESKERIERLITTGEKDGAKVALDGRGYTVPGYEEGYFVGPTVLENVPLASAAYAEEIFGPVIEIIRVETLQEAIDLVNANPYGNGTAIFTKNGAAARTFQRKINVGMVGVNVPVPVPVAYHSFGGWKDSLFGDLHMYGPDGIRFYTRGKVITTRWPDEKGVATRASFNFEAR